MIRRTIKRIIAAARRRRQALVSFTPLFLFLSAAAWPQEWERIVREAEKEGGLSLYVFDGGPLTIEAVDAFQKAFPRIKVSQLRGRGNDIGPRILAERRAEKYLVVGGKGTAHATLYVGKVLDPLKPLLVLPEVVDTSRWWQGKHKYVDLEGKYILAFIGNAGGVEVNYNTKMVDPGAFKSYWDLIQPKWKGRIVGQDPRMRGMDTPVLYFYYHSRLGPEFMRRFFTETEITISRDYRQTVDWLATGRFAVCLPCVTDEMDRAIAQGLAVSRVNTLREGGTLTSAGGTVSYLNRAPHPNAAKVFVNWLLSREGQMSVQKERKGRPGTASDSLRIDIPKDEVPDDRRRQEGVEYFDGDDPKLSDRRPADKLLNELLR
jgi:ABC-type Fe3+ transport system substrate-binding protein